MNRYIALGIQVYCPRYTATNPGVRVKWMDQVHCSRCQGVVE